MGGAAAAAALGMNEDEETYAAELCAALAAARTEPAAFEERVLRPLRARYHGLLLDGGSGKSARRLTAEGRGGLEAAAFALRRAAAVGPLGGGGKRCAAAAAAALREVARQPAGAATVREIGRGDGDGDAAGAAACAVCSVFWPGASAELAVALLLVGDGDDQRAARSACLDPRYEVVAAAAEERSGAIALVLAASAEALPSPVKRKPSEEQLQSAGGSPQALRPSASDLIGARRSVIRQTDRAQTSRTAAASKQSLAHTARIGDEMRKSSSAQFQRFAESMR